MPTDEVTDADREAAALFMLNQGSWTMKHYHAKCIRRGDNDDAPLVQAFAAHRTASEQRGYDRAIAEVVAWLREQHDGRLASRTYLADAIEAGEHKP